MSIYVDTMRHRLTNLIASDRHECGQGERRSTDDCVNETDLCRDGFVNEGDEASDGRRWRRRVRNETTLSLCQSASDGRESLYKTCV